MSDLWDNAISKNGQSYPNWHESIFDDWIYKNGIQKSISSKIFKKKFEKKLKKKDEKKIWKNIFFQ